MKRFFLFLIMATIVVSLAFGIIKSKNSYILNSLSKELDIRINIKGLNNSKSFDIDENGNLYIAFEDTIKVIGEEGDIKAIIKEGSFNIYDVVYFNEKLYIATDNRIVEYNLIDKNYNTLVENLPNKGLNNDISILIRDEKLLFEIGSNTNDGIVNKVGEIEDIATGSWILNGENFGDGVTGAFSPYSISTESGESVKGEKIGNAAIYELDLVSLETKLISHGIRSISGWDLNSENKIIAVVGGILDNTVRNIKNDKDYIYKIEDDIWYGWPDYSGGDPITSPRFTDDKINNFLIKNHIDKNPSGPLYQYDYVNSLKALAVDKDGKLLEKDSIIFSDSSNKVIYSLNTNGYLKEIIKLSEDSTINKIIVNDNGIYILDSQEGALYKIIKDQNLGGFKLPYEIWAFIIGLVLTVITVILIKNKKKIKRV